MRQISDLRLVSETSEMAAFRGKLHSKRPLLRPVLLHRCRWRGK
jgi:hypothetical protein